jgi:dynactin 1
VADYETTIGQFRELVLSLQAYVTLLALGSPSLVADPIYPTPLPFPRSLLARSLVYSDLEQLRHHQQTQQSESQSLTSQSQAMLNLNLKLQSSVLKGQVKTIELELRKLEARQAGDMLGLIKVRSGFSLLTQRENKS